MQFLRASLAIAVFAALTASPVLGASVHRSSAKSHATHLAGGSTTHSSHATHSDGGSTTHSSHAARGRHAKHSAEAADATPSAPSTSGSRASRRGHKATVQAHRSHGQQAIDTARVTEIQQALIREHYLSGEATGSWDDTTKAAMLKYQADQGWQTKLTPDSRALKKLGLGPDYSGAINAKDSSFAAPTPKDVIPAEQKEGFAAAAGVKE